MSKQIIWTIEHSPDSVEPLWFVMKNGRVVEVNTSPIGANIMLVIHKCVDRIEA